MALSTKNLSNEQKEQILTSAGLITTEKQLTAAQISERLAKELNSKADAEAMLVNAGIITQKELEENATVKVTVAKINESVANGTLSASDAAVIAGSLGIASANTGATISFKLFTAAIWNNIKALFVWLTTNPVGWATLAIGALAGVVGIFKAVTTSMEEASEATTDAISELSSITSEVETLERKITDLKSQIDGLDPITDEEDIRRLEAETLELENQLAILKEKERLAKEDTDEKAQESLGKTQTSRYEVIEGQSQVVNGYIQETGGAYAEVTREEELKNAMKAYDEYYKQRLALEEELAGMRATDEGYAEKQRAVDALNQQMKDARTHASELALALDEEKAGLSGTTAESKALLDSTNATLLTYSQWLNGIDGTTDALNKNANAIDNVTASATKFTKTQMIDTINSMADGFDVLDDIYADVLDGGTFDFTKLDTSKFSEAFSEITPEYEKFIETVSASPTDIEACQGAFNDLVSAFIDSKGILDGVDEETKQLTIDMLENMGVVNAEEVVMSAINAKLNEYADAKSVCASAGIDLTNATRLEILELMREQEMSEETRISLWRYQMQKALSNENGINTVYDCVQLENLARAAGYTGSALIYLGKIKALLNKIENDKLDEDSLGYKSVMGQVKNYNGLLQDLLSTELATTKATVNYGGASKTAAVAQDKLKDSTKKATDALEKQKEVLNEQKSELEALHGAIIDYIDDEIEEIEDKTSAIEKQNDKLKDQLDVYDDIISAVTNNIDIEIDAIDDKIDKLRDANDEEERGIALEEAKRKLLEARSRKTKLVYTKNAGFTYQTDSKAISEATSELESLQQEELINSLEKEKELLEENKQKWLEIADAREKALQAASAAKYFGNNWRDTTLNPSDKMIGKLQGDYVGTQIKIEQNDSRIEELNKEKEFWENEKKLWQDALDEYEKQQNRARLESFFGSDYEHQLLNNSAVWRRKFANEYSSICSEIEALEERIKLANESTASSVESSANRVADSAKTVGSSMDEMKKKYKWSPEDTASLEYASQRLDALNELIAQGRTELTDARDKVANFVDQYSKLEDSRVVTEDLKNSVQELNGVYSDSDDYLEQMASSVSDRLADSKNYTEELVQNTQTTAEALTTANQAIQEMKTSEETIDEEANKVVYNTEQTISNLLTKLGELKTNLSEIIASRTEVETIADEELLDTSTVVDVVHTKVGEIQSAMTLLLESITPLEGALDTLMEKLTTLDEVTLSGVIGAFGGASGGEGGESKESGSKSSSKGKKGSEGESVGGSCLLSAVKAVDEAIGSVDNEESLLGKLAQVDASTLKNIIAQFGLSGENGDSEGANLLNAVNAVSQAIVGGGKDDENSLIASIEQLGSDPTIEHVTTVSDSFQTLHDTINECVKKVEELSKAIESIPSSTATVGVNGGKSSGRAKGGIITKEDEGDLDFVAKSLGEDHMVALTEGEAVIPKENVAKNPEVVQSLIDGEPLKPITPEPILVNKKQLELEAYWNAMESSGMFLESPKQYAPKLRNNIAGNIVNNNQQKSTTVSIGDIHVHGVQNADAFAREIETKMSRKVTQALSKNNL